MEQSGSITTGNLAAREICARISFTGELFYSQKPKMIHSAPPRRLFICRLQSPTSSLRLPTSTDGFFYKVRSQTRRFPAALSHQLRSRAHVYLRFCCSPQLFFPHPSFFFPALKRWPATAILESVASGVRVKHRANKHDLDKRN